MSVLVSDRKESKFEAITYSVELRYLLVELMQRGFGIKDINAVARRRYIIKSDTKFQKSYRQNNLIAYA